MIFTRSPRARQKNRRAVAAGSPTVNRAALARARVCLQVLLTEARLRAATRRSRASHATREVAEEAEGAGAAVADVVAVPTGRAKAQAQAKGRAQPKASTAIAVNMAVAVAVNAAGSPVPWITAIATRTAATTWATRRGLPEAAASNAAEAANVLVAAGAADAAADSSPTFRSR